MGWIVLALAISLLLSVGILVFAARASYRRKRERGERLSVRREPGIDV